MLVVSDSSPLNFLVRMNLREIPGQVFGQVWIPPQVAAELDAPNSPHEVRRFIESPPAWLRIEAPRSELHLPKLDPGEVSAISLAVERKAEFVLIDDGPARRVAFALGLSVIGLLGVLGRASARGLIDFRESAARIPADYRIDQALLDKLIKQHQPPKPGDRPPL